MTGTGARELRRSAAGILGMLLLFAILLSAFFIAAEADHDCAGDDCPVCACIRLCEDTLCRISGGRAVLAALAVPAIFSLSSIFIPAFHSLRETPVSRKVRLNN